MGAEWAKLLNKGGHGSAIRGVRPVYQKQYLMSRVGTRGVFYLDGMDKKTPPPVRRGGGCPNRLPVTRYDRGVTEHIAGGGMGVKVGTVQRGVSPRPVRGVYRCP